MKLRTQKITALMAAAVLGISAFGSVPVTAAESTETADIGEAMAVDGEAVSSDLVAGTFKPSDVTCKAQDSYEYPFLGLKLSLSKELLKQINRDYGITIVVVTHEMSVVQEICNQVAILNEGNVVETGSVSEIFTAPKSPEAKSLIIGSGSTAKEMRGRHCIRIVFKENSSYEPVVGNMTLQFKTPVNILYANTKDLNGTAAGEMILQLPEDTEIAGKMVEYLKEKNLYVGEVEQDVFI